MVHRVHGTVFRAEYELRRSLQRKRESVQNKVLNKVQCTEITSKRLGVTLNREVVNRAHGKLLSCVTELSICVQRTLGSDQK